MATRSDIDMIFTSVYDKIRDQAVIIGMARPDEYKTALRMTRVLRDWSIRMSGNKDFRDLPDNPEELNGTQ